MKKILTVVGARPQLIKAAAVSRILRQSFYEIFVDTGQHYDYTMAGVFYEELDIPKPDHMLGIGSGTHAEQTGRMLIELEKVMMSHSPDAVLVYGDTNSTLAAALAASKLHIPVVHVEAGLRSFNRRMPEEINRVVTDHLSSLLFSPTVQAVEQLRKEGITNHVYLVGDVMYDAVLYYWSKAEELCSLQKFGVEKRSYVLVTIHRAENTDQPERLSAIVRSLTKLDYPIVFPMHPRTKKALNQIGLLDTLLHCSHIQVTEPVSYLEMLHLERHALAIVTDSGGVQKEAYFAKVPCFTLRDETEWTETVEVGWNRLVDPLTEDLSKIIRSFSPPPYVDGLYGDGQAAKKIVHHLQDWLKEVSHGASSW